MKKTDVPDNAKELSELICEREGKNLSMDIAQVKEVIAVISDLVEEEWQMSESRYILDIFIKNGARRAKRYQKNS